jgi:hypothetical protein
VVEGRISDIIFALDFGEDDCLVIKTDVVVFEELQLPMHIVTHLQNKKAVGTYHSADMRNVASSE